MEILPKKAKLAAPFRAAKPLLKTCRPKRKSPEVQPPGSINAKDA
jgi:hypothetical protein